MIMTRTIIIIILVIVCIPSKSYIFQDFDLLRIVIEGHQIIYQLRHAQAAENNNSNNWREIYKQAEGFVWMGAELDLETEPDGHEREEGG